MNHSLRCTRIVLCAIMLVFVSVVSGFSAEKKESLKVSGNCGSCKKRIEKAVKSVSGVQTASWDKNTKMLTVTFDDSKTALATIKTKIVEVGHDIETEKSTDAVYSALPKCCKYRDADAKTH
jgi:mercuric ion binding protein